MEQLLSLGEPARLPLAQLPTPLRYVSSQHLWLKRDDATAQEASGNKLRKLEYLVAEAQALGKSSLVTCGGEQSNHARATAVVAAQLGMTCHLYLRTADPQHPPALSGNLLISRMCGATLHWMSYADWPNRDTIMAAHAAQHPDSYVIPAGGSNALGCWGYIRAVFELVAQLDDANMHQPLTIIYACGSGGTGAGLLLGAKAAGLLGSRLHVVGVNVCDDRMYFEREITTITTSARSRWPFLPVVSAEDIRIADGYVGRGYAKTTDTELSQLVAFARASGVVLDSTYTGKAMLGLLAERAQGALPTTDVLFLHTGGLFGAFASSELRVALRDAT